MQKMLFNDKYGLTAAVLNGTKTMTRRNTPKELPDAIRCGYDRFEIVDGKELRCWKDETSSFIKFKLPYQIGEIVAIAQCYYDIFIEDGLRAENGERIINIPIKNISDTAGWNNKLFVRADLMPHHIRITDVRTERLQDIRDEDCMKEGIWKDKLGHYGFGLYLESPIYSTPREAFAALIDKVSGKGTWARNPYVFVYQFETVD